MPCSPGGADGRRCAVWTNPCRRAASSQVGGPQREDAPRRGPGLAAGGRLP
ncbi:hypothetical protein DVDV_3444 [Desulfovibrio sp. DV]|nr:hypothetical protein DVDV_3444 [Desulfovibrio sp. DV]